MTIERVGLVGCVNGKLDRAAPAADLYVSPLFRKRRRYVERTCDRWFVLSALHGLVEPTLTIEPYNSTLSGRSTHLKRTWSEEVLSSLQSALGPLSSFVFEVHAGADYRDFGLVSGLLQEGARVDNPTKGLTHGRQLQFYNTSGSLSLGTTETSSPRSTPDQQHAAREGKYKPLADHLEHAPGAEVRLTFWEIERLLAQPLPPSARKHQAWWANDPTHSHANSWLSVGWVLARADLNAATVVFHRVGGAQ